MNLAGLSSRCHNLALWKLRTRVWGYYVSACSGDRLRNLRLHRFDLLGRNQKRTFEKLGPRSFTVVDPGIEIQRRSDLPLNEEIVRDWRGVW